jgi:lysophospholipase L1-like esterase
MLTGTAHARSIITLVSGQDASDLVCPEAPLPQASPVHLRSAGPAHAEIPDASELGLLRKPVIRAQPSIDPQLISGFAIQDAGKTRRIAIWGDSHIAAGPFAPTMIDALRAQGLTVGARFLPPTMGRANTHLPSLRAFCMGDGWSTQLSYTSAGTLRAGPGLVNRVAEGGADSYLWLDLRDASRRPTVRQLQVVYRAPAGSTLALSLNNGPEQEARLNATEDSQTLTIGGDQPISTVRLRVVQGKFVLHGFVLDYDDPPNVIFDVFGIPSSTARGWANSDADYLAQSLHAVSYDAVILEYGTNEGNDPRFDPNQYATGLKAVLTNLRRVFPSASCVLVGPPDRGVLMSRNGVGFDPLSFSRIHQQIAKVQEQVAPQFDCAAWNWQDLMGGPGGSYGWALASPSLMGPDLTHLSPEGYRKTARALATSLGWTERH